MTRGLVATRSRGWAAAVLAVAMMCFCLDGAVAQQPQIVRPNTTEIRKTRPPEARPPEARPAEAPPPAALFRPSMAEEADAAEEAAVSKAATTATATDLMITAARKGTTISIAVSKPVDISAFTLPDPYRIILDVADLGFDLPKTLPTGGLVTAIRYGLLAPGRSRIVMDVSAPVRIARAEAVPVLSGAGANIVVVLEPTDRSKFMAALQPKEPPATPAAAGKPQTTGGGKPVVVIDPGHGGLDPGALGQNGIREKDLTLAVSRQVRSQLMAKGRYDVRMTRPGDEFISLDQRVAFSQAADADLFVSIHADSVGDDSLAQAVRGASVYTLSAEASHKQAKVLAEKENSADLRAGLTAAAGSGGDQIKSILFDLMQREAHNFSNEIRGLLVSNLKRSVALAKEPARSAAFKVLQQSHAPSVLIELGYLSHTEDATLLQSPEWQRQVASSIVAAIEQYFAKHLAAKR